VRHSLTGERSGRVFQLAGRVAVKVARVDLERAKIDFTLDVDAQVGEPRPVAEARPAFAQPLARGDRPRDGTRRASRKTRRG
jgi:ribonuclease R